MRGRQLGRAASVTVVIFWAGSAARAADPAVTTAAPPAYTLASFPLTDGTDPVANVTLDAAGNLYGTASTGGNTYGVGTVFEFDAATHTDRTLLSFNRSTNGSYPGAGIAVDAAGNLFGGTSTTAFQLAAGTRAYTQIAAFNGSPLTGPNSTLTADAAGDLFGASGTAVFEIAAGTRALTQVADLTNTGAVSPNSSLVFDKAGNLFGTTILSRNVAGQNGRASIFKVAAGTHAVTVLTPFTTPAGNPIGGLTADAAGNLYGEYSNQIYELPAGGSTITTLYTFPTASETDGTGPIGTLAIDAAGDLFGATATGGTLPNGQSGDGTVFELTAGTTRTLYTLATFDGSDTGDDPSAGVVRDAAGNLYGTTARGGPGSGTVFELSPVAVPEPAAVGLAAVAVLSAAARRRRARQG